MQQSHLITDREVGVVGLGLMGSSIVVSFLAAGHRVKAVAPIPDDLEQAPLRIRQHLAQCEKNNLLQDGIEGALARLEISSDYGSLRDCELVMECVIELPAVKQAIYAEIEKNVSAECVIASNTSAIPISELQLMVKRPQRFLGIHWAEPSYLTRFLEITCGSHTDPEVAEQIFSWSACWGKEPTLLKKDIRGFITNRLMYAMYREAFHLVEKHGISFETIDKACRYDAGAWMTLMGVFRRMDYLGLENYSHFLETLFPLLSNSEEVPAIMQDLIRRRARGTQSQDGLYAYDAASARFFEEAFAQFNEDIYRLAARYPNQQFISPAGNLTPATYDE